MNITSLIFALQSFVEAVAEREIRRQNRSAKQQTLHDIQMLKSIDSARRQIVHSEGYSVEFLLNLLTYTIIQMESDNKLSRPGGIIRKDSDVDKLYQLLRLMTVRYFNSASKI